MVYEAVLRQRPGAAFEEDSLMRVSLTGDTIAKLLAASDASLGVFRTGRSYDLVRIPLLKVGCPKELAACQDNRRNVPLVIERNRQRLGAIQATGYYPAAVVVAGAYRRDHLLARGILDAWGWVERGAFELQAAASISCGELMEKLCGLLCSRFYGAQTPICGQPWPGIFQVYPFEGYCIYDFGGQKYRQAFALGPDGHDVTLSGESVKVAENFVAASVSGMLKTQSGMRQVGTPMPLASNHTSSPGGANSDLVRMVVRNSPSITKAVAQLLDAIKFGLYKPMKPAFSPVNLSDGGKVLGPLVEAGIAPSDFVVWADRNGGEFLEGREFSDKSRVKLADKGIAMKDGSYPIANRSDLGNAVRSFGRSPDKATKAHIIKRAKALGAPDALPATWKVA